MRSFIARLRTTTPNIENLWAWLAVAAVAAFLATTGPARADVDPCSFRPFPSPDRSTKGILYQAPDAFTPDQRKVS